MRRTFKLTLLGLLFLGGGVVVFQQLNISIHFPIKTVRVYGTERVDEADVQALLEPLLSRGFFGINVEYIRDRLLQQPWASDAFVRRNWPDQLEVKIVERRAIAVWNEGVLLSDGGELFSPKKETIPEKLPVFVGPQGKQIVMLGYFNEINRIFSPIHAKISYLELTPYLTWKVKLDNGITLQIGHKDILTRLGHFVKVYPKMIGTHASDVEYIDLRYPNGVAIRWRPPVAT